MQFISMLPPEGMQMFQWQLLEYLFNGTYKYEFEFQIIYAAH